MSYKMGGHDDGKGSLDRHKKIDDSVGMCGSESDYDSCWSRMCSPDKSTALRDVLRGLLVLIALAIVVTIIFLLCFFLLNDMEQKEEELVDNLIKDFATGTRVDTDPEFSVIGDENRLSKYPYDIDLPPDQEKKAVTEKEETKLPENDLSDGSSDYNAEDDLYLSFGNVDSSKTMSGDSEIANTEGSFINAFVPPAEDHDAFHIEAELVESKSTKECVSLRLPLCSGSMPWTVTTFPNFVNNNNADELQESLMYFQSIIVGSRCSTRGAEYTCAILEPACGPDGVPLPPCRAFCQDIRKTCSEYLISGNVHNEALDCDRFPDSRNPNVCVDLNPASSNSSPKEKSSNDQESGDEKAANDQSVVNNSEVNKFGELQDSTPTISKDDLKVQPKESNPEKQPGSENPSEATTDPPVFICDHTKFLCDDGSDCLGEESVCDGVQHCLDNSDEFNCTQPEDSTISVDLSFAADFPPIETAAETTISTLHHKIARQRKDDISHFLQKDEDTEIKSAKRASLSEILSSSSLVGAPKTLEQTQPPVISKNNPKPSRGKAISPPKIVERKRSVVPSLAFTARPINIEERTNKSPTKLSLASLLSSSGKPNAPSQFEDRPSDFEEYVPSPSQRTLSTLLSSSHPSFSTLRGSSGDGCPEFKCLGDGYCISFSRVNDGVRDCRDGSDERNMNHIRVK